MLSTYKEKIERHKQKIIKKDVKYFKKLCIKKFKENIENGLDTTMIDFCFNVNHDFEKEISKIVLKELTQEHEDIEFSFCFRGYASSYKGIKMVVK